MHKHLTATFFVSSFATLAIVHVLATKFFLYWMYFWLDIPVHFLGGVTVVLGFLLCRELTHAIPERYYTYVPALTVVLIVGLLWELFEVMIGASLDDDGFVFDFFKDISMDVLGGLLGYMLIEQLRKFN